MNKFIIMIVVSFVNIFLAACEEVYYIEGPQGPVGEKGDPGQLGENGADGEDGEDFPSCQLDSECAEGDVCRLPQGICLPAFLFEEEVDECEPYLDYPQPGEYVTSMLSWKESGRIEVQAVEGGREVQATALFQSLCGDGLVVNSMYVEFHDVPIFFPFYNEDGEVIGGGYTIPTEMQGFTSLVLQPLTAPLFEGTSDRGQYFYGEVNLPDRSIDAGEVATAVARITLPDSATDEDIARLWVMLYLSVTDVISGNSYSIGLSIQ